MNVVHLRDVRVTSPDIIIVENIGDTNYNHFHEYGIDFTGNDNNVVGVWKRKKKYKHTFTINA